MTPRRGRLRRRRGSSLFRAALNDSASAFLSALHPPRRRGLGDPELLAEPGRGPSGRVLRSVVGVEDRPTQRPSVGQGGLERVLDEAGAHVVGDRPADELA